MFGGSRRWLWPASRSAERPADLVRKGNRASADRDWAQAAEHYAAALALDPSQSPIWFQHGHMRKELGFPAEAEASYRRALLLVPEYAEGYLHLGHALKMQGRKDEALEAYRRAFRLSWDARSGSHAAAELIGLGVAAGDLLADLVPGASGVRRPGPVYLGYGRSMIRLAGGEPFVVDTQSMDFGYAVMETGSWEDWILPAVLPFVHESAVIVDVGSNVGFYSVVLGRRARKGRLYAFEPNKRSFDILMTNLEVNNLERRRCRHAAVGAEEGEVRLNVGFGEAGRGYVTTMDDVVMPYFETTAVPQVTLDAAIPVRERIDVLKIDVEGYECEVIHGASRVLKNRQAAAILIESSPDNWERRGFEPSYPFAQIVAQGYRLELLLYEGRQPVTPAEAVERSLALPYVTSVLATRE